MRREFARICVSLWATYAQAKSVQRLLSFCLTLLACGDRDYSAGGAVSGGQVITSGASDSSETGLGTSHGSSGHAGADEGSMGVSDSSGGTFCPECHWWERGRDAPGTTGTTGASSGPECPPDDDGDD